MGAPSAIRAELLNALRGALVDLELLTSISHALFRSILIVHAALACPATGECQPGVEIAARSIRDLVHVAPLRGPICDHSSPALLRIKINIQGRPLRQFWMLPPRTPPSRVAPA
jgi:hypothetical protein